ncbi:MAG: type IV secretory system conjugative DNA transfer family protein [Acidimicrobiales bacterium]
MPPPGLGRGARGSPPLRGGSTSGLALLAAAVVVADATGWLAAALDGWLGDSGPRWTSPEAGLRVTASMVSALAAGSGRGVVPVPPWAFAVALACVALAGFAAWRVAVALRRRWTAGPGRLTAGSMRPGRSGRRHRRRSVQRDWPGRGARWASGRDLAALRVRGRGAGRLTLGRDRRGALAAEPAQSVIVVGPTQTHKTSGFALPAILEWEGPVLATSVKSDLVRHSSAWRRSLGDVWIYDPTGTTGMACSGWSPLEAAITWAGARRVAASLCSSARASSGSVPDADFWYSTAAKLLAPLLFAAACSGREMREVVAWVDEQEVGAVEEILVELDVPEARRAAHASWAREERQRSSVYTTAETVLEAFADPAVAGSTYREVSAARLLNGGSHTLYVCAPAHEQRRLRPLFGTLVQEVLRAAYELATLRGRPLDPPLLCVLDEAANIAPLEDLDALAATAAGHGVQLVTVWQDIAQISARYGDRSATVVNNHRAKVVLSGISDPATLAQVSTLVGEEETSWSSETTDADGRRSTTRSSGARALAPADSLRRIRPGHGLLVYGHLPPARLRLRPWFEEASLRRRVGVGQEAGCTQAPDRR